MTNERIPDSPETKGLKEETEKQAAVWANVLGIGVRTREQFVNLMRDLNRRIQEQLSPKDKQD